MISERQRTSDFVRLLTQHERHVYTYILSLVPNWADADEILQETNVRLWEQFDRFEPGTNFAAWARTIAHYMVLAFRTRVGRERVRFSQEFVDAIEAEMEGFTEEMDGRRAALSECVKELPAPNRRLIDLVYEGGLSIKAVAEKVGRPATATYKALERVRRALHDCISRRLSEEASQR